MQGGKYEIADGISCRTAAVPSEQAAVIFPEPVGPAPGDSNDCQSPHCTVRGFSCGPDRVQEIGPGLPELPELGTLPYAR